MNFVLGPVGLFSGANWLLGLGRLILKKFATAVASAAALPAWMAAKNVKTDPEEDEANELNELNYSPEN